MTIMITGSKGQLGMELGALLEERGLPYYGYDSEQMDITDKTQVAERFAECHPTVVFHCAAYTAVDKAEEEGRQVNQQVNVEGTANVAEAAEAYGAVFVYLSTDYVFDGEKTNGPYKEEDPVNPINQYGQAKLAAEEKIKELCASYYIIRTTWVFGVYGGNFVFTMQRLANAHPKLTVVDDQVGRPTWTRNLAEFMLYAYEQQLDYGTYNFSNDGQCSWYQFACEILKNTSVDIRPVTSDQFPQKAKRPAYSVLDLSKVKATGFVIPTWQDALEQMLAQAKEKKH